MFWLLVVSLAVMLICIVLHASQHFRFAPCWKAKVVQLPQFNRRHSPHSSLPDGGTRDRASSRTRLSNAVRLAAQDSMNRLHQVEWVRCNNVRCPYHSQPLILTLSFVTILTANTLYILSMESIFLSNRRGWWPNAVSRRLTTKSSTFIRWHYCFITHFYSQWHFSFWSRIICVTTQRHWVKSNLILIHRFDMLHIPPSSIRFVGSLFIVSFSSFRENPISIFISVTLSALILSVFNPIHSIPFGIPFDAITIHKFTMSSDYAMD